MDANRQSAARRLNVAIALMDEGDFVAACDAATLACEAAPEWPDSWFVLAECCERADRIPDAAAAYRRSLDCDPSDRLGASARLAMIGAGDTPERLSPAYVRALFDEIAPIFDESLIDRLGYRGPQLLAAAVSPHLPAMPSPLTVLDLGCGTGLGGQAFRTVATRLDGIDLSPGMVGEVARKGFYDSVRVADLHDAPPATAPRYGLVLASDVLNYIGDLTPTFAAAAVWLIPDGLFAFTIEAGCDGPYELGPGQRFRHDPIAVRAWLAALGFRIVHDEPAVLRRERQMPVDGRVFVARLAGVTPGMRSDDMAGNATLSGADADRVGNLPSLPH
jgi:predicted TPR repeat methyltransferase